MIAGMIDRKICTIAKNHWPDICCRTWSRIWLRFSSPYRWVSLRCWLKLFARRMPETLSASCVIAVMSDSDSCVCAAIRARTCPTRRWAMTRSGSSTTATRVICQLSSSMATTAAMTVTVLPRTEEIVLLRTLATPPTSFCSRDWMIPVFVRVKNASSMRWRWPKSRIRIAPMTLLPTVAVRYVCQTPTPALAIQSATIPATSAERTGRSGPPPSFGKSPSSKARWVSSGGMTERAAPTRTSTTVSTIEVRCGTNRPEMRCRR